MTDPTPNDLLARAAELLGEKGWCQGALRTAEGQMCAMGAMAYAKKELFGMSIYGPEPKIGPHVRKAANTYAGAYQKLIKVINEPGTDPYAPLISIPHWNDEDYQTAESVILALKTAANND